MPAGTSAAKPAVSPEDTSEDTAGPPPSIPCVTTAPAQVIRELVRWLVWMQSVEQPGLKTHQKQFGPLYYYTFKVNWNPYSRITFRFYLQIEPVPSDAGNTSEEDEFFKHSLPPPPCFFFIDKKDWTKLRKKQFLYNFKTLNWTSVMSKGIRTIHPLCSFAFKRHEIHWLQ